MGVQPAGTAWPEDGELPPEKVGDGSSPFAAYVHVPFCTVRCGYCDFNTYTKDFGPGANLATYGESVEKEIRDSQRILEAAGLPARPLRSVFFGGGTPSLMSPDAIARIMDVLEAAHGFADSPEVTLELNPETASEQRIRRFRAAGVTRLSVGMQSASPRVLGILDRTHTPSNVPLAINWAQEAGLGTSLDLIYGSPTETLGEWEASLEAAIQMNPDHLSAYSLIVEPGTKMAAQVARGELPEPDPDLDAEKYVLADRLLGDAGYSWYELSNFAKSEEDRSVHNLAYWRGWDWWGYGPGAHSHLGGLRWWNVKHPLAYAGKVSRDTSPGFQGELLTLEDQRVEAVMLGIRTREGLLVTPQNKAAGERLVQEGLVDQDFFAEGSLTLTLKGRLLADLVTRTLLGWE